MLKVESNVPTPPLDRRKPHTDALWKAMQSCEVGDSVYIQQPRRWVSTFLSRNQGKLGSYHRFIARQEGEGCRIWRIA